MIAKLAGILDQVAADSAIIDVSGVGYLAYCSTRTLGRLSKVGEPVRLLIETHVREDHIHLYGFIDAAERDWFRLLTTVQGVGARLALAVLSVLGPEQLGFTVLAQDKSSLARAEGVGPRLAARIVNELRDKAGALAMAPATTTPQVPAAARVGEGATADAVSALVNLGYRQAEAFGAVATAARRLGAEAPLEALIRIGLQELAAGAPS